MKPTLKTIMGAFLIFALFIAINTGSAYAAEEVTTEQIKQTQTELGKLYNQLMQFKDKQSFHENGLETEDPESYRWLADVNALDEMIDDRDGYTELVQDAPERLKDLAEEYKDSKGKETKEAMELTQEFKRALK